MASNIILYTNLECSSPYVLSVYATLVEKGLPFELKAIDLASKENLQPEYRRISLTSRIPTLLDGEFSLSESSAIIEYLEDAYTAPDFRSEEHTSELQSLMRISYAVYCLKKKKQKVIIIHTQYHKSTHKTNHILQI